VATPPSYIAELSSADPGDLGGKARSLVRLAALGLRVPQGFCVRDELARELLGSRAPDGDRAKLLHAPFPLGFDRELSAALARLPAARFSVRSSFSGEDRPGELAAGVYASRVDVAADEVPAALRDVLASASTESAHAYARAHARPPLAPPLAVLVHGFADGHAHGHAAAAAPPVSWTRTGQLSPDEEKRLLHAIASLQAAVGPVEVEWVCDAAGFVFLQMRPFAAAPSPATSTSSPDTERAVAEGWRWDAAHNPYPLSVAQQGLVALVDERTHTGVRQRVIDGYLFFRTDQRRDGGADPQGDEDVMAAQAVFDALAGTVKEARHRWGATPPLEEALALFVSVYEPLFGRVSPAAKRARRDFAQWIHAHAPQHRHQVPAWLAGVTSKATLRRRRLSSLALARDRPSPEAQSARHLAGHLADFLAEFGDEAAVWDVAEPTFSERPDDVVSAAHVTGDAVVVQLDPRAVAATLPPDLVPAFHAALSRARTAAALAENDDWLYARLQTLVRRALLALGARLALDGRLASPDEIFSLPLDLCRSLAADPSRDHPLRELIAQARDHLARAYERPPLLAAPPANDVFRGHGTGGRFVGRVQTRRKPGEDRTAPARDAVLVTFTLLPTELPLLAPGAIVTEFGGPLDHVASQARERGLPAVVGAGGVMTGLADGDIVLVDADEGVVRRWTRG
jgi:phosphohistidine swiveling domain-containing protein